MARIAYVGNFRHPHCTERHLAQTLVSLGHKVLLLQENTTTLPKILEDASSAELLIYTRTWGLPKAATHIWRALEAEGVKTASYHLDLYLGLKREDTLHEDPFWTTSTCFTPDGDPESQGRFLEHGINHIYMPPAVFEPECIPGRVRRDFSSDVAFVGSYPYPHVDEWPYRDQLVEFLMSTYGKRFRRFGGGARVVRNQDLNDVYASVKVVVGDSLCPRFTKPMYWSDRPYETVGRGGFLIMPRITGLEEHFVDGEHLRYYDFCKFDQLKELVNYYVANQGEARAIAEAGQTHVRANHTYTHRMRAMLDILGIK